MAERLMSGLPGIPIVVNRFLARDDFFMWDNRGPIYASPVAMRLFGLLYLCGDWHGGLRDWLAQDEDLTPSPPACAEGEGEGGA